VKRQIGQAAVTNKDDLMQRLIWALRSMQKMPAKIAAFFRHSECRYVRWTHSVGQVSGLQK